MKTIIIILIIIKLGTFALALGSINEEVNANVPSFIN